MRSARRNERYVSASRRRKNYAPGETKVATVEHANNSWLFLCSKVRPVEQPTARSSFDAGATTRHHRRRILAVMDGPATAGHLLGCQALIPGAECPQEAAPFIA
jgi:hypothetical protein